MSLKLKIPPPVQGLIWGLIMWGVAQVMSGWNHTFSGQKYVGFALIFVGLSIEFISAAAFFRQKTTVNPLKPENATSLVSSGLYKISRNPMYLGLLTLLSGWAVILGNPVNIAALAAFVAGMNWLQIIPEEKHLTRKFGQSYKDYKRRVRRWI